MQLFTQIREKKKRVGEKKKSRFIRNLRLTYGVTFVAFWDLG